MTQTCLETQPHPLLSRTSKLQPRTGKCDIALLCFGTHHVHPLMNGTAHYLREADADLLPTLIIHYFPFMAKRYTWSVPRTFRIRLFIHPPHLTVEGFGNVSFGRRPQPLTRPQHMCAYVAWINPPGPDNSQIWS